MPLQAEFFVADLGEFLFWLAVRFTFESHLWKKADGPKDSWVVADPATRLLAEELV